MMRLFPSLLLALALVLTGQGMAMARGGSAASGQMVICTGTGPMVVHVDAQGQPTHAPVLCPDAALHAPLAAALSRPAVPASRIAYVPPSQPAPTKARNHAKPTPPSRAPPLMV